MAFYLNKLLLMIFWTSLVVVGEKFCETIIIFILLLHVYLLLKRGIWPFIPNKSIPNYLRMLCATFGENQFSGLL